MDRIESTVVCETLSQFLDDATRVGYCFRCGVPVDPSADEWANVAQVMQPLGTCVVVGGMLCEPCVESWREWVEGGYAVERCSSCGSGDLRLDASTDSLDCVSCGDAHRRRDAKVSRA